MIEDAEKVHESVLPKEVMLYAQVIPGMKVIDATLDGAGHALMMLEAMEGNGRLLGIEKDPEMVKIAHQRLKNFENNIRIATDSFEHIDTIARNEGFLEADLIFFDLGVSSFHFDRSERGFSFLHDAPLDMRLSPRQEISAAHIISSYPQDQLEKIFYEFGDERNARRIAHAIVQARKKQRIITTGQLADIIMQIIPRRGRIHPATKTFQALRIAVNDEMGTLERTLPKALQILRPGGRLLVISFHSKEDRIVKHFLQSMVREGRVELMVKKPIIPSRQEVIHNPRSRSAKLRIAIKK